MPLLSGDFVTSDRTMPVDAIAGGGVRSRQGVVLGIPGRRSKLLYRKELPCRGAAGGAGLPGRGENARQEVRPLR